MNNHIFCLLGKSSVGKDKLFQTLIADGSLGLVRIIPYTTRPIRSGEQEGREYHFVTEERYQELHKAGLIAEERSYHTVCGLWRYFTVLRGEVDLDRHSYLLIGTLESFVTLRAYCDLHYGQGRVIPLYIEVEDGDRLTRALNREKKQSRPNYAEMCRRFLADTADFAPEKLKEAGIDAGDTFENPAGQLEQCADALRKRIRMCQ